MSASSAAFENAGRLRKSAHQRSYEPPKPSRRARATDANSSW